MRPGAVTLVVAALGMLQGDLDAQVPTHRDRGEVRERVRMMSVPRLEEREALHVVALQPLVFEPAGAGEVRIVDPLTDQAARGEFEVHGEGWVEITLHLVLDQTAGVVPLDLQMHAGDLAFVEPSGREIVPRRVEHLQERGGLRIRAEVPVRGVVLVLLGGAVAPALDHPPGEYRSRVRVSGRYLDH